MRILDKYILKELMGPFVFGVCAFSSVFIGTSTLFRIAQYITQYGASTSAVIKLFFYSLPKIISLTFPMAMLLASLLSFGRLSSSSEITAMKSGGLSFYRLAAPVLAMAFAISVFAVVFNEKVVPAATNAYYRVVHYEIERNTKPKAQEHIILKDVKAGNIERLTYAKRFDETEGRMVGVTVEEFDDGRLTRVQHAEDAVWGQNAWTLHNGMIYDLSSPDGETRTLEFTKQILPLQSTPDDIGRGQKTAEEMTIRELKQHIDVLQRQSVSSLNYEVELHQRLSIPMACFIFALVGTPLGLQPHRASSSIGMGISIIIIFIYYTIMTLTTALGQGGAIPAVLSAWIPNIVCLLGGLWLIRKKAL